MYVTLKQLKLLKAIDTCKSFTRAAKAENISQSAVSQQMKLLEECIGAPLWEKVNKRIDLTPTGTLVLQAAQDVLARLDHLEGEIEALRGKVGGPLDIAVVTSAKVFLPHYLGEFVRAHPLVKPRLTVTNRASVLAALEENRHDLYIMGQVPAELHVEARPFLDNILEVVAAPDHPLCGKRNIPLSRIAEERFLVREQGSGTRIAVDRLFAEHHLQITPFMELGNGEAIKNGVMAGLGIAVLSRHSLPMELKTGSIEILDAQAFPLRRRWYVVFPRGKRLSVAAETFMEHLLKADRETESILSAAQ